MGYVPLNNYKYDSGYRRIQTGPDNQGFIVLTSGQSAYGANEGIVVAGSPLSGTIAAGAWDYDSNWRYVPGVSPSQSGSALDPTPYNASGAILDTYKGTRIATRTQVAGAQAANAIGPEANVVQPRQAPLQPRASVTQPEKYMYFGGAAPDNQGYSPYNTPDANTPAEGRTGGPVTHRNYENTLLTNVFGTQGTSDRSQWRYHQPVYCKTYTETIRSQSPGLMSTPLRYIYRGNSTQYNLNYPLNNGFQQLPYDDQTGGCGIPVSCPTTTGFNTFLVPGDVLVASAPCIYDVIRWYNTLSSDAIGEGTSYTIQESDVNTQIYFVVTYPDTTTDSSSTSCLGLVSVSLAYNYFQLYSTKWYATFQPYNPFAFIPSFDTYGSAYVDSWWEGGGGSIPLSNPYIPVVTKVDKDRNIIWTYNYLIGDGSVQYVYDYQSHCSVNGLIYSFFFRREGTGTTNYIRLYNLILNESTGSIESIRGIRYYSSSFYFPYPNPNNAVLQVETDGFGTFWLLCDVREYFVSGSSAIAEVRAVICLTTNSNGELVTAWTWEILRSQNNSGDYNESVSDYMRVDIENNRICLNSVSTRTPPVILNATTGAVIYKGDYYAESSSLLSVHEVLLDDESNLYEGQTKNSPNNFINLYNYPTSSLWISKKDVYGNILWMNNYTQAIYSNTSTALSYILPNGSFLLIQDILLVLIIRQGSLPTYQWAQLLMLDPSDGSILRYTVIKPPSSYSTFGSDIKILQAPKPDEFNIVCSAGYHLTLNINDIPLNSNIGTITPSGSSYYYSFTDTIPSGITSYTSVVATGIPFPPERTWGVTGTPFVVSTASGEAQAPASTTNCTNITYR